MAPHLQSFMIETSLLLILLEAVSRHEFPGLNNREKHAISCLALTLLFPG